MGLAVVSMLATSLNVMADSAQDNCVKNASDCKSPEPPRSDCDQCEATYLCNLQCGCPYEQNVLTCQQAASSGFGACKLAHCYTHGKL